MPTDQIIALLIAERDKLNRAIEALGGIVGKRKGRPPKNPLSPAAPPPAAPAKTRRGGMSAAARKAQSARMRAYWAAKRKNEKKT
jgi:hypothetical protein